MLRVGTFCQLVLNKHSNLFCIYSEEIKGILLPQIHENINVHVKECKVC